MSTDVRVPTLGESVTEATVATWFKKPGEAVAVDEMLCELETDKVTVEVPSPVAGTLGEIVANEGDTVGVDGDLLSIPQQQVVASILRAIQGVRVGACAGVATEKICGERAARERRIVGRIGEVGHRSKAAGSGDA